MSNVAMQDRLAFMGLGAPSAAYRSI